MNVLGIIAEFNPFHTGHEYLIKHLRRETGADFCVAVMSGDYVQRGEPAFFSKYLRTKAALLSGVDLVLELPLSVSTGSAEYFAEGAVSLLNRLGCVTHLGFGSESGDIHAFLSAGKLLSGVPTCYDELLQKNLRAGLNFPKARYEALSACLKMQGSQENGISGQSIPARNAADQKEPASEDLIFSPENISKLLSLLDAPNNILGTEYCKALYKLESSMIPVTSRRLGAGYHEEVKRLSDSPYASASGLRHAFLSARTSDDREFLLKNYVPEPCRPLYRDALQQKEYVTFENFYLPLCYALQYADAESLVRFQDVTPEFARRLLGSFRECACVAELCDVLKTKNLTAARIRRCLLHILLHLAKDAVDAQKEQGLSLYARILGFRREAEPLLSEIGRHASVPLVSKPADASKNLSSLALAQFEQTVKASELYRTAVPDAKSGSEYTQSIIIL